MYYMCIPCALHFTVHFELADAFLMLLFWACLDKAYGLWRTRATTWATAGTTMASSSSDVCVGHSLSKSVTVSFIICSATFCHHGLSWFAFFSLQMWILVLWILSTEAGDSAYWLQGCRGQSSWRCVDMLHKGFSVEWSTSGLDRMFLLSAGGQQKHLPDQCLAAQGCHFGFSLKSRALST